MRGLEFLIPDDVSQFLRTSSSRKVDEIFRFQESVIGAISPSVHCQCRASHCESL